MWSTSLALVYSRTPIVTTTVPKPLRNVTGLPNKITDIHIRKALFTVLATLKIDNYHIRSMYTTIITICDNACYNDNITTCNHVSPRPNRKRCKASTLFMWYIYISKSIPSTVFSRFKSLNINPWRRQKKNGIWSKRLIIYSCIYVRPEINNLMPFTYDLLLSV